MNMHEECLKRQNEGYHTPLPEVIERIERDSRKLKPSYAILDIQDAIYYLKEHKNQQDFYDQSIQRTTEMIDNCEKTVAEYLAVNNPPLTWDELKMMTGKPIWIEDAFEKGEWYIIECFTDSNRFIAHDRWSGDDIFRKLYMDTEWFAYRKERS